MEGMATFVGMKVVIRTAVVAPEYAGWYLVDFALAQMEELPSRNAVKTAIKQERLQVAGVPQPTGYRVQVGDEVCLMAPEGPAPKEYRMELEVLYLDAHMAVVYKPPGLPTSGNAFRTLQNVLVGQLEPTDLPDALPWARPVHRLDGPTQGLVLVARSQRALTQLGHQLAARAVRKTYHAVVHGALEGRHVVREPIKRQMAHSEVQGLVVNPEAHRGALSLVRLWPHTGRTHQLRIHLAEMGHPILGDVQYIKAQQTLQHKGLFLAATRLQLAHPLSGEELDVLAPIPEKFWRRLGLEKQDLPEG